MTEGQQTTPARNAPPAGTPSRRPVFLRRALRWATAALTVFALGIVALWLVQVRPLRLRLSALEREQQKLQAYVADLESQVAHLESVESENESLRAEKASLGLQVAVLQARVGTVKAQHILASDGAARDVVQALGLADEQLELLASRLPAEKQEAVRSLRYRLAMVVGEIESNPFAAQRDLEVLAEGLEVLERDLAAE